MTFSLLRFLLLLLLCAGARAADPLPPIATWHEPFVGARNGGSSRWHAMKRSVKRMGNSAQLSLGLGAGLASGALVLSMRTGLPLRSLI